MKKLQERRGRKEKTAHRIVNLLIACCLVIFISSAGGIAYYMYHTFRNQKQAEGLRETAYVEEAGGSSVQKKEKKKNNTEEKALSEQVIDFAALKRKNPDASAWIKIPGTAIDYPVMADHEEDENYYLWRDFYKKADYHGSLYFHAGHGFGVPKTVTAIYGHHMRDGTMFAGLLKYQDEAYCQEHSAIYIYTEEYNYLYEPLCVFRMDADDTVEGFSYGGYYDLSEKAVFERFSEQADARAYYHTNVLWNQNASYLLLSTCEYTVENGRFVLLAKCRMKEKIS